MNIVQILSLIAEIIVAALGILIVVKKKKIYGLGICLTFGIYVFYDISRFLSVPVPPGLSDTLFLIASASILWVVWSLSKVER
ncbi:MAG: hypothetical protein ABH843_04185 [Candidatus Omnitrophota bacterium]